MNEEQENPGIPHVMARLKNTDGANSLNLFLGTNIVTGVPLVGDKIEDSLSGRMFIVIDRTWIGGETRSASIVITLSEIPEQQG